MRRNRRIPHKVEVKVEVEAKVEVEVKVERKVEVKAKVEVEYRQLRGLAGFDNTSTVS